MLSRYDGVSDLSVSITCSNQENMTCAIESVHSRYWVVSSKQRLYHMTKEGGTLPNKQIDCVRSRMCSPQKNCLVQSWRGGSCEDRMDNAMRMATCWKGIGIAMPSLIGSNTKHIDIILAWLWPGLEYVSGWMMWPTLIENITWQFDCLRALMCCSTPQEQQSFKTDQIMYRCELD